jgi:hypothetical protein
MPVKLQGNRQVRPVDHGLAGISQPGTTDPPKALPQTSESQKEAFLLHRFSFRESA